MFSPMALSRIVTGILRDSLGFDGVVISDDLQMKAITSVYGLEAAIELALNAGIDMLLFGNNTGTYDEDIAVKAITIIHTLVQSGRIAPARIDESFTLVYDALITRAGSQLERARTSGAESHGVGGDA